MRRIGRRPFIDRPTINAIVAAAIIGDRCSSGKAITKIVALASCLTFCPRSGMPLWISCLLLCGPALAERTITAIFNKLANGHGHHQSGDSSHEHADAHQCPKNP